MKFIIVTAIILLALTAGTLSQTVDYSFFSYQYFVPDVDINVRSATLQQSLYPDLYQQERSVRQDMRWINDNSLELVEFWNTRGDTVLHIIRELGGIEWRETNFPIYLMRYFPSLGSSNPMVMPMGSFGDGKVLEAAAEDDIRILILTYLLAHRALDQTIYPPRGIHLSIASHPLMRPGPYRRDCLAWLLAKTACESIIGYEATTVAFNSAFIKNHQPGRRIFEKYFLNGWILTPEHTLADWIASESYSSNLVLATRPPVITSTTNSTQPVHIEGLPLKGQLGFTVKLDESNRIMINKIDTYRLGYACGLREDDRIYRVNGQRPRNHKTLVERLLSRLYEGGSTLDIVRDGQSRAIIIQPILGNIEPLLDDIYDSYGPQMPDSSYQPATEDQY